MSVDKVIKVAQSEIGYLEKATNSFLNLKQFNAGSKNYTKYAKDLDSIKDFYSGKKNGYAWCAVFVNWCFVQAYGLDKARSMCYLPVKSGSASCTIAMNYYKDNGAFYREPKVGDQVFFANAKGSVIHTGLVEKVTSTTLYTIEGNTSTSEGVIENGGGVFRKSYKLTNSRIVGYGRPNYGNAVEIIPIKSNPKTVKDIQAWLNDEFDANLVADNEFGSLTKVALIKAAQTSIGVTADGIFGQNSRKAWKNVKRGSKGAQAKVVQAMLICLGYSCGEYGADGDFGTDSVNALKRYQKNNKLVADGIAGMGTAAKMFAR